MILKVPSTPCQVALQWDAVVPQIQAHLQSIPGAAAELETSIGANWQQWLIGSQPCALGAGDLVGTGFGHFSPSNAPCLVREAAPRSTALWGPYGLLKWGCCAEGLQGLFPSSPPPLPQHHADPKPSVTPRCCSQPSSPHSLGLIGATFISLFILIFSKKNSGCRIGFAAVAM